MARYSAPHKLQRQQRPKDLWLSPTLEHCALRSPEIVPTEAHDQCVHHHISPHCTDPPGTPSGICEDAICEIQLCIQWDFSQQNGGQMTPRGCQSARMQTYQRVSDRATADCQAEDPSLSNPDTGALRGCVFFNPLYTPTAHQPTPQPKMIKTVDDSTLVGLIQNSNQSAYKGEVSELSLCCSSTSLTLNTSKNKGDDHQLQETERGTCSHTLEETE